jgi:hypothetical protein
VKVGYSWRVAVVAVDLQTHVGYQFKGRAELMDEGPLFEEMAALLAHGTNGPPPMKLWFERDARELMTAQGRAGRPEAGRATSSCAISLLAFNPRR